MYASFDHITHESSSIKTFYFRPERPVDYSAGQFVELTLMHASLNAKESKRWFTLSSSPTEPQVAVTVKCAGRNSSFKQALQRLQPGDGVQIGDPLGDFVLPLDTSIPLVWIAGGIGITPFRSMATWLADNSNKREITLFHSVSNQDEALFADVIRQAGIKKHYIIDTSVSNGARLSAKDIKATVANQTNPYYYISGPESMVITLAAELQAEAIGREQIVSDIFIGYR